MNQGWKLPNNVHIVDDTIAVYFLNKNDKI